MPNPCRLRGKAAKLIVIGAALFIPDSPLIAAVRLHSSRLHPPAVQA